MTATCECQAALRRAVSKRLRAVARDEAWLAELDPALRSYWAGSITSTLLRKPARVVIAGGCSCGAPEAVESRRADCL